MIILAVDTALGACSAAILDGDAVLARHWSAMVRGQAESLAPMVESCIAEAGLGFAALDRLAVTTGPGTFTGQRVGLAFMRGLRLALGCPLAGVTTLDAMAAAAVAESGKSLIAVLHEAKRGEVYATLQANGATLLPVQVAAFEAMMAAILKACGAATVTLAGTAAEAAAEWLRERGAATVLTDIRQPDAVWVGRLGLRAPAPDGPPKPLYLRAPDAKLSANPLSGVCLRAGGPADVTVLAGLHAQCFDEGWNTASFAGLLASPGAAAAILEQDGTPIGFALVRHAADEAELLSIGVLERWRRGGHGRDLLSAAARQAQDLGANSLFLEVAHDNHAARALYSRLGFHCVGTRKSYYRDGAGAGRDAFVLRADLPLEIQGLGKRPEID